MKDYLNFIENQLEAVGAGLKADFKKVKRFGRRAAIQTKYDRRSDRLIRRAIENNFPNHSWLTEEAGLKLKDKNFFWIVDPLDGTGNFVNFNPFFAVSIAFWAEGRLAAAGIEAPWLGERYLAVRGGGSWVKNLASCKTRRIKVSKISKLTDSFVVFCNGHRASRPRTLKAINQLYPKVSGLRKLGSAAIELAWVALGRAEAFFVPQVNLWDVAAGTLLIEEAGGAVFDFQGRPINFSKLIFQPRPINFLATNQKIILPKKIDY